MDDYWKKQDDEEDAKPEADQEPQKQPETAQAAEKKQDK